MLAIPEPTVIYENENFLAVNKPPGLMVHGVKIAERKQHQRAGVHELPEPTLVDWLIKKYPEIKNVGDDPVLRPGIVHRLDKETSGIILIPKTQEYFEYLKFLFQKHNIRKTYYAVVRGVLKNEKGRIDAPIGIKNGTLKRSIHSTKMQKEAVTEYKIIKAWNSGGSSSSSGASLADETLLEVHPLSGRTHQIRVHLASIGHPIIGDKLYGPKKSSASRLMLHAAAIEFSDRDGSRINLSTAFPFTEKR